MTNNYNIQYIPTGHIFLLPRGECDRLVLESEHNYRVLDEGYELPSKPSKEIKSNLLETIIEKKAVKKVPKAVKSAKVSKTSKAQIK